MSEQERCSPAHPPRRNFITAHRTGWGARRARKQWITSIRGRDAYVYRLGRFRWVCSRIDYDPVGPAPPAGRRIA